MPRQLENLTGKTLGHWQVLSLAPKRKGKTCWNCRCLNCGKESVIPATNLKQGRSLSCRDCKLGSTGKSGSSQMQSSEKRANRRKKTKRKREREYSENIHKGQVFGHFRVWGYAGEPSRSDLRDMGVTRKQFRKDMAHRPKWAVSCSRCERHRFLTVKGRDLLSGRVTGCPLHSAPHPRWTHPWEYACYLNMI
jgi:hypothetical protein